jgi:hypothetical protein
MKKTPVGWFTDPSSQAIVIVLARDGESAQDAINRVAGDHAVAATEISTTAPAIGAGANIEVEVPHSAEGAPRIHRERGSDRTREPERENPATGVARFMDRANKASSLQPTEPPIVTSLLPRLGNQ